MSISKNSGHKARNIAVFLVLMVIVQRISGAEHGVGPVPSEQWKASEFLTQLAQDSGITFPEELLITKNLKEKEKNNLSTLISALKSMEEKSVIDKITLDFLIENKLLDSAITFLPISDGAIKEKNKMVCSYLYKLKQLKSKNLDAYLIYSSKFLKGNCDTDNSFYFFSELTEAIFKHYREVKNIPEPLNKLISEHKDLISEHKDLIFSDFLTIFSKKMEETSKKINNSEYWDTEYPEVYKTWRDLNQKKNMTIEKEEYQKLLSSVLKEKDSNITAESFSQNQTVDKARSLFIKKNLQTDTLLDFFKEIKLGFKSYIDREIKKLTPFLEGTIHKSWQTLFRRMQAEFHPDSVTDEKQKEILEPISKIFNNFFASKEFVTIITIDEFIEKYKKLKPNLSAIESKKAALIPVFLKTLKKIQYNPDLKYNKDNFDELIKKSKLRIDNARAKEEQDAKDALNTLAEAEAEENPQKQQPITAPTTTSASNTANTTSFQHAERSAYWDYHKSTDSVYTKDHFGGQYDHGVTQYAFQQMGEKNQSGQQNINLIVQDDQQGGEKTMAAKEFLQDSTGLNGVMTTDKKSIPEITTVSAVKKSKSELEKLLKRSIPLLKKRVSKNPRTAALAHQTKQQKFYQIRHQNPSGQQNIALIAQDDQQGGEKTMTVKEFLQDLTGQNGVMMAAKKSIPEITSMSDVRKSKSELEKLMKRVDPLFKKRVSKNPRTAALAHQTKQQNQWVTSVNNWLTTLNQADKSANRLTINPTEEHIILELSERKAIIKGFSGLLKDLNQQSKNILKANRDKKLEKQAQLRAKKESERLNKKSVSKKAPMESFGQINKGGSHRARRLDHSSTA